MKKSKLEDILELLKDGGEALASGGFGFGDEAAVDFELWLGTGRADGEPGAVGEAVFEEVCWRQTVEAGCIIEAFAVREESSTAVAQSGHDGADFLLAGDALQFVRLLCIVIVAVFLVKRGEAVAEDFS